MPREGFQPARGGGGGGGSVFHAFVFLDTLVIVYDARGNEDVTAQHIVSKFIGK